MQQGMLLQRPVFKMNPTTEFWDQSRVSPQTPTPPNTINAAAATVNNASINRTLASNQSNSQPALNGNNAAAAAAAAVVAATINNQNNMMVASQQQQQQQSILGQVKAEQINNAARRTPDTNCGAQSLSLSNYNNPEANTNNASAAAANSLDNQSIESANMNQNNVVALPDPKIMTEKLVSELQIFMHKSMQMQLQQRGGGAASVGSSSFGSSGGLEISKPHQCQQCLKSFSSNHQLVQHIRVHTGEKPYKCSYCERRFKQLSHVQQHTRLHTGERPYRCHLAECGRAFIQLSNLQQHLRNHDAQVERAKNRPFHCTICGKGFATESSLRTHAAKEAELRMDVLQQHAAMIGGATTTSCPICHKLLIGTDALIEHMKYNHKDPQPPPSPLASLLSHMEHMRMDPKHQFAAQYVLSRAAAERRERESLLAAAALATSGALPLGLSGTQSSMCPSPSMQSDTSSNNGDGRLSSTGSETPAGLLLHNNNNNTNTSNNNTNGSNNNSSNPVNISSGNSTNNSHTSSNNNNNNNSTNNNNNNNNESLAAMKLAELMVGKAGGNNNPYLNQQNIPQFNADELQKAATALIMSQQQAVAAAAAVAQSVSSAQDSRSPSTAVQVAAANLAAAMRMTQSTSLVQHNQPLTNQSSFGGMSNPTDGMAAMQMAMNAAVRASMSSMVVDASLNHQQNNHQSILHQQQQSSTSPTLRMQEAILRSQAEAALRLAVSQAVAASTSTGNGDNSNNNLQSMHGISTHNMMGNQNTLVNGQHHPYHHQSQVSPELTEALRLQEQRLEQALRIHGDPRALGFPFTNAQQHHMNP